ncbi:MAG: AEC family transporter [Endomicrobium sp.]|jgi:predicted permease|nr:AEC family transporter [Endomicrobium sp.]
MFDNLVSLFVMVSLGVCFQLKRPGNISPSTAAHVINTSVVKFFFPAFCFKAISAADVSRDVLLLPLSAMITVSSSLLISFTIYTIIEKLTALNKKEKGVLILTSSFGNITFLGLLLLTDLYGKNAAGYVLVYDLLAINPLVWLVGTTIASYYGNREKSTIISPLRTVLALPPVWALFAGFIANFAGLRFPSFLTKTLELISTPIVPLMIFSMGLTLKIPKLKYLIISIPAILTKLCLGPLIAFGVALLLNIDGLALKSTVMEAAMPSMILTLIISSQYKLDHNLNAFIILSTTIISLITLPTVAQLIQGY